MNEDLDLSVYSASDRASNKNSSQVKSVFSGKGNSSKLQGPPIIEITRHNPSTIDPYHEEIILEQNSVRTSIDEEPQKIILLVPVTQLETQQFTNT